MVCRASGRHSNRDWTILLQKLLERAMLLGLSKKSSVSVRVPPIVAGTKGFCRAFFVDFEFSLRVKNNILFTLRIYIPPEVLDPSEGMWINRVSWWALMWMNIQSHGLFGIG